MSDDNTGEVYSEASGNEENIVDNETNTEKKSGKGLKIGAGLAVAVLVGALAWGSFGQSGFIASIGSNVDRGALEDLIDVDAEFGGSGSSNSLTNAAESFAAGVGGDGGGSSSGGGSGDLSAPVEPPVVGDPQEVFEGHDPGEWSITAQEPNSTVLTTTDTASWEMFQSLLGRANTIEDINPDSVRPAEWANALEHDFLEAPVDEDFAVSSALTAPLWSSQHHEDTQLLRVGINASEGVERNPVNLTIIVDVSGSMSAEDRLEHVKNATIDLLSETQEGDLISLVAFNDGVETVAEAEANPETLEDAVMSLEPGGSTNTAAGLGQGFLLADNKRQQNSDADDVVVLLADGAANRGETDYNTIVDTLADNSGGAVLHTVGIGTQVYNDELLSGLARELSGTYTYLGHGEQAATLFSEELPVLNPVGQDVKAQIQFNEDVVESYRMVGSEERELDDEDLHDEDVRGGFIGEGQNYVGVYEVALTGEPGPIGDYELVYEGQGREIEILEGTLDPVDSVDNDFAAVLAVAEYFRDADHLSVDIDDAVDVLLGSEVQELRSIGQQLDQVLNAPVVEPYEDELHEQNEW